MRVLMFGWEFPPYNSGGLGTACYGLTKGLSNRGVDVTFVLPRTPGAEYDFVNVVAADMEKVKLRGIKTMLQGYSTSESYHEQTARLAGRFDPSIEIYGADLMEEVKLYTQKAAKIALEEHFDVIHAHDWLTFSAGVAAKARTGKPLVVHVHATEFDRTGGNGVNQDVYEVERTGMHAADAIIAVSNFTKQKIVDHYDVDADKIHVVHNAIDKEPPIEHVEKHGKTVLFLGRLTLQKGPDYFLEAARRVLEVEPDTRFVIAGSGDMEKRMMDQAARAGIADKVLFTGFLRLKDIPKAYRMADLYVMPSVSEPFGITPLEAASLGTPTLVSKQSGVSEVLTNCLKVDFWDVEQMANKMVAVLRYAPLHNAIAENSYRDVEKMSWDTSAEQCKSVYSKVA